MSDSLLMLAWLALAVSHGFNTVAVLWLLRGRGRKYTINFAGSSVLPKGAFVAGAAASKGVAP